MPDFFIRLALFSWYVNLVNIIDIHMGNSLQLYLLNLLDIYA